MPAIPTFEELYTDSQTEITRRNPDLTDFEEGSNLDALAGGGSVLGDLTLGYALDLFAAQFLDTAEGTELDDLVADRFGLTRQAATASIGSVTFTRGSYVGAWSIPAGTQVQASVGGEDILFTTDALVSMGASDNTVTASATAAVAGRSGNVPADTLTQILDVLTDTTATVTNPDRMAGGAEAETDEALRERARLFYTTLRRGTVAAIEAGALSVAGVSYAKVDESNPPANGALSVYVGDPDGTANASLVALVQAALEDYRPAGIQVDVIASQREEIVIQLEVLVLAGTASATLETAIREAVKAYVNDLAPSEVLYDSQLVHAALRVGEEVLDVTVVFPSGDFTPSQPYNAVRVVDSDLTLTLTEV